MSTLLREMFWSPEAQPDAYASGAAWTTARSVTGRFIELLSGAKGG